MNGWWFAARGLVIVSIVFLSLVTNGCEGTDTREKVDDTVESVTGKKSVERYQQMKKDLGEIQKQQDQRYRQLDPDKKDE